VRNDMTICNLDGVNPLDRNSWRTSVRRCQPARCCLPRSPGQLQHHKYQNRIWYGGTPPGESQRVMLELPLDLQHAESLKSAIFGINLSP